MTGLVRKATLLSVGGLFIAGAAMAGLPNAANSTVRSIGLLPHSNPVDPLTTARAGIPTLYCITVRDENNAVVPNVAVTLDVVNCTTAGATDITICSLQSAPGHTVSCNSGNRRITLTADINGLACFNIIGNSNNSTGSTPVSAPCIQVFAGSTLLGTVAYSAYDQDGAGGTGVTDLFLFFQDLAFSAGTCSTYPCSINGPPSTTRRRSDYDNNCCINVTDLFLFFAVQGGAFSTNSCSPNPNCIP